MSTAVIQPSFAAGELSPNLYARVDLAKYHIGAATMRNFFVDYRGGAASRPGSKFIGRSYSPAAATPAGLSPVRLIPFSFNIQQTYVFEFGNNYMRIITNGAYIVENPVSISAISQANPGVFTATAHGYSNNQWVVLSGIGGMTSLNGKTYIVQNVTTNTFTLTDLYGNVINTTALPAYTGGGSASRIYTVVTPYAATDLKLLKWTQSADVMTFTHPSYPIYKLTRTGNTAWTFAQVNYATVQVAPTAISATPTTTTAPLASFSYVVTAVNAITGEESIASNIVTAQSSDIAQTAGSITVTWNAAAGAGSYNIYKAPIGYSASTTPVGALFGLAGSTIGLQFVDGNTTADFTITPPQANNPFAPGQILYVTMTANGTGYTQATATATISTSTGSNVILQPVVIGGLVQACLVPNAGQLYAPGDTVVFHDSGSGTGATGTLTIGPATGTTPGCTAYFQQRQYFANSINNPDTFWATKPGAFTNMDQSNPVQATDAIEDTLAAQQVNGIQFMIPMPSGLVVLTGLGAWQLTGGANNTAVTPQDADATPQAYNGCSFYVPPIPINYDILYVQQKGSIIRDLAYNFFVNIYTGTDLTVLSNQLFTGYQILEWAWAEEPYKLIWAVRNDGVILSLTYLKEQDVYAWARHDTFGLYQSVCTVSETITVNGLPVGVNAIYVVVERLINGQYIQYIERFDDRLWTTIENTWAVDAGLQTISNMPNANLKASAASGSAVTFTADQPVFNSGMVGNVIRMGYGIATVTAFVSSTQLTASITQNITTNLPNDPNNTPIPAASGQWSINPVNTTFSGLDHLNGCLVSILADGSVQTPQIVVNGSITLQTGASFVTIGLGFQAQLASLYLDVGSQQTVQGKRKSVPAVTIRMVNSRGIKAGQGSFANVVEIKQRGNAIFAGQPIPLFTGDERIILNPTYNKTGQVFIQQDYPLPATVLGIMPEINVGDTNG